MLNTNYSKYIGVCAGAFILFPFKLKPFLVFVLFLFSIYTFLKNKTEKTIEFRKIIMINLVLFAYVFSFLYSENLDRAIDYIVRSSPLFVLPLSFAIISEEYSKSLIDYLKKSFIISNAIYIVLMFIYLYSIGFLNSKNDLYYYYSYITYEFYSIGDHPIYLTTQFSIAFFLLIKAKFHKNLKIILFLVLLTGIFFLSRKGVIISFFLSLTGYLLLVLKDKKIFLKMLGGVVLLFSLSLFIPEIKMRFNELFDKTNYQDQETSTGIRIILWKNSIELIEDSFLFGYGIGDSQDVLSQRIEKQGFFKISAKKSNCHNQYLQFLLSIGLVGLSTFIFTIVYFYINFIKTNNYLGICILSFFLLIFTTESFLDRQNGIILFSLFIAIFIFQNDNFKIKSEENINNRSVSLPN